ncbi:MAG: serine protease [Nanoarchaeota archaeon]|nr:serine protease [Nanoarchaeota archaeon]MBU1632816.1 serine protease [Nanoarchaeota archaeon]MBU1876491.1 serine protease [Nanoarchaeota archaeon]
MTFKKCALTSLLLTLGACSGTSCSRTYERPPITQEVRDRNDNNLNSDTINEILDASVKIRSKYTYLENIDDMTSIELKIKGSLGSGVVLYDDDKEEFYVITANHVLPPKEIENGILLEQTVTAGEIEGEVIKRNEGIDLALLKLTGGKFMPYTRKFAQDTNIGDYVIGAGFPSGGQKILFKGFISSYDIRDEVPVHTVIDSSISPGDSGSGTYILQNGKAHLAGIVQVYYLNKRGQAGMSPLSYLRNFVKDTDIEDEYL